MKGHPSGPRPGRGVEGRKRPDRKGPEKVGDLLAEFLEAKGLREPVLQVGAVEAWEERVGENIARVTRARGIRDHVLVVEVKSSAWLMELNLMREEILRRLNEGRSEGLVEKIVFVLAEV